MGEEEKSDLRLEFERGQVPVVLGRPEQKEERWNVETRMGEKLMPPKKLGKHIVWALPKGFQLRHLDFGYYLPLFLSGICETEDPLSLIAEQGASQLIDYGGRHLRLFTVL